MVLLRWLSPWFLISKEPFKVHQKDILDLATDTLYLRKGSTWERMLET